MTFWGVCTYVHTHTHAHKFTQWKKCECSTVCVKVLFVERINEFRLEEFPDFPLVSIRRVQRAIKFWECFK